METRRLVPRVVGTASRKPLSPPRGKSRNYHKLVTSHIVHVQREAVDPLRDFCQIDAHSFCFYYRHLLPLAHPTEQLMTKHPVPQEQNPNNTVSTSLNTYPALQCSGFLRSCTLWTRRRCVRSSRKYLMKRMGSGVGIAKRKTRK